MAKSTLHEQSSIVLKSIRNNRKNFTISHIPIRKSSTLDQTLIKTNTDLIQKTIVPEENSMNTINNEIEFYIYTSGNRMTRRNVPLVSEWMKNKMPKLIS